MLSTDADGKKGETQLCTYFEELFCFVLFCSVLIDSSITQMAWKQMLFQIKVYCPHTPTRRQDTELCVAKDSPILCVFPFYGKGFILWQRGFTICRLWPSLAEETVSFSCSFAHMHTWKHTHTHTHTWVNVKSFTSTNGRNFSTSYKSCPLLAGITHLCGTPQRKLCFNSCGTIFGE